MIILSFLSLFFSVLSHDYYLLPFTWKNVSNLKEGKEYNLVLETSHTEIYIKIVARYLSSYTFSCFYI